MKDHAARQALAAAIAEATSAEAAANKARAAVERAEAFAREARAAHDEAVAALDRAIAEQGESVAAALESGASAEAAIGAGAVRSARSKIVATEDDLNSARSALAKLKAAVDEPGYYEKQAKAHLRAAVVAVVTAHVEDFIAEVERIQADLEGKRAVLWVIRGEMLDLPSSPRSRLETFLRADPLPNERVAAWDRAESVAELRRAMDALSRDANAPFPITASPPAAGGGRLLGLRVGFGAQRQAGGAA